MIQRYLVTTSCLILCCLIMLSCSSSEQGKTEDLLDQIVKRKELVVLTTNQPTTYYIDRDENPTGPEHDMTRSFAQSLGVETRYIEFDSTESVIDALRKGEGDIAAAGLTITERKESGIRFRTCLHGCQ